MTLQRVGYLDTDQFAREIAPPVGVELSGTFQAKDATLTSLASLGWTAGTMAVVFTAADTTSLIHVGAASATDILDRQSADTRYAISSGLAAIATSGSANDLIAGTVSAVRGGTGTGTYALGDILYSSATNTLAKLAGNTTSTNKFLAQTGTGSVSAAPAWVTILAADVPTLNQNTTGSAAKLTTARAIDGQNFDGTAAITVIAPGTHAASSKTPPVDADELPLVDSAASNVLKKLTWANLKATVVTYITGLANTWSAVQTFATTNVPITLNSTNSNGNKIAMKDNGTAVGFFGGSSSFPFFVSDSGGTNRLRMDTSFNLQVDSFLALLTTKGVKVAGNQIITDRQAAVADATGAGDVVAQLNALLARLRTHGLISP